MEGKAVLFKKFAGIDVFDIEVDAADPERFCDVVAALEPTFGAINLEDIKAPECFAIEAEAARAHEDPGVPRRPARHRDHRRRRGAQRAAAAGQEAARGASWSPPARARRRSPASICWCSMGLRRENVTLTDIKGVVYARAATEHAAEHGALRAGDRGAHACRTCWRAPMCSSASPRRGVLKPEWLPMLADKPLILALANPEPEILPEAVRAGAAGRDRRHRAQRLPEPGQQRPLLPLHLPRRAGRAARPPSTRR